MSVACSSAMLKIKVRW